MNNKIKIITKYLLIFLAAFVPFRELIALYTNSFVKFLPDLLIWSLLFVLVIKKKFVLNLKKYDYFFILFIIVGFVSCLVNSVSLLAFALQVRSICTMYGLFYILRNVSLDSKDYKIVISILMVVNIVIICGTFVEYLWDKELLFPATWAKNIIYKSNFVRTYSFMNNPNTFAIFTFMVMFLVYYFNKNNWKKIFVLYYILCFLGIILSASRSTMLIVLAFFGFLLLMSIKNKTYYNLAIMLLIVGVSFTLSIGLEMFKNSDVFKNLNTRYGNSMVVKKPEKDESDKDSGSTIGNMAIVNRWEETTSGTTITNSTENGRIFIIKKGFSIFIDYPIIGTGFGTFGSAASRMVTPDLYEKYDLYEKFYSDNEYIKIIVETGIIGTLIFGLFVLTLLWELYKEKDYYRVFILLAFLFIGLFYNVFELQVLCLVLYFSLIAMKNVNEVKLKDKKIALLSLHLGVGGTEQVIVNTANMLVDKYTVEIISLYNRKEPIPFPLNKKVKVTYLMNCVSNRNEFKKVWSRFNLFGIIREGFKAIYILIKKDYLMKKAIIDCDAKIVISTRYGFSKILNYFGNSDAIKIHQEHTYSVSDRYIEQLNDLKNMNYLMPVSNTLLDEYSNRVKIPMYYIPLALNYFPDTSEMSILNTKNLIAVGRLEKEKGFSELLEVISKLRDKRIFLNLFGDGSQMSHLVDKAEKLGISDRVKFWGQKSQDFIKTYMKESALYVMTSFEESFGLVLIEAMSYGIPCIAYDSAKGAKYTINKTNGYFIKNRNQAEMIKTINNYLELSSDNKKNLGKNARKTSENYKYDIIQKKWQDFINSILEAN